MSTIQRSRPPESVATVRPGRAFLRELLTFGFVGCVGTLIMVLGANLMRAWLGGSPITSVVVPGIVSTLTSYLANRFWTFRHRDSDGSGREVAVFFTLNGIGILIQVACTGFTHYTLGLQSGIAYNAALLAGVGLGAAWRYWSYKRWVFTLATG